MKVISSHAIPDNRMASPCMQSTTTTQPPSELEADSQLAPSRAKDSLELTSVFVLTVTPTLSVPFSMAARASACDISYNRLCRLHPLPKLLPQNLKIGHQRHLNPFVHLLIRIHRKFTRIQLRQSTILQRPRQRMYGIPG